MKHSHRRSPEAPFVVGMVDKIALQEQLNKLSEMFDSKVEVVGYNRLAKNTTKLAKEVDRLVGELQAARELLTEMEDISLCSDTLHFLTDQVFRRVSATYPSDEWDTFADFMYKFDTDKARQDALRSALKDLQIDSDDFDVVVEFQRERICQARIWKPEALVTAVDSRQVGTVCAPAKVIVLKYREIIASAGRRRVL